TELGSTREAQYPSPLTSHNRAVQTMESGRFAQEFVPVFAPPYKQAVIEDVGPRKDQTLEALAKLKPYFDRKYGTVTVGNSCPITDGAAAILVASAEKARALGLRPAGRIKGYAFVGLD